MEIAYLNFARAVIKKVIILQIQFAEIDNFQLVELTGRQKTKYLPLTSGTSKQEI